MLIGVCNVWRLVVRRLCLEMLELDGVKPIIHQSELRTYTKVVPFKEKKILSLCCIVKNTEWNGIINIDN